MPPHGGGVVSLYSPVFVNKATIGSVFDTKPGWSDNVKRLSMVIRVLPMPIIIGFLITQCRTHTPSSIDFALTSDD